MDIQLVSSFSTVNSVRRSNSLGWALLFCCIRSFNRASITSVRYSNLLWSATVSNEANAHLQRRGWWDAAGEATAALAATGAADWLVFDGETLLFLQRVHHGREEELVLQQLRQPLATPVELILPRVLIRDADKDSHAYDGPWYRPGKTAGGDPHLADVFDARLHQRFILARKEGKKGSFSIVCVTVVRVTFCCCFTAPPGKRSWRQSACSLGRESCRRFPSDQLFLSADPQNLGRRVR